MLLPLRGTLSPLGAAKGGFTPLALNGLAGWYAADTITGLSDGAAVAQWDDLSGNGRHLTNGTGTQQPTYKTAIQNGKPVVRFDGTADRLARTGISGVNVTRVLVAVVARTTSLVGERHAFNTTQSGTNNVGFRILTTFRPAIGGVVNTANTANTSWHVHVFWRTSATLFYSLDGVQVSNAASFSASVAPDVFRIGAENTSRFWEGDVAEVVIVARASGDFDVTTEVGALQTYCRNKYAI